MSRIRLNIPADWQCQVVGAIEMSDHPADLSEDMLDVILPNGFLVSAGWIPDGGPNGQYVVTLTSGGRHIIDSYESKSPLDAFQAVLERIDQYRWRNLNVSQSADTPVIYPVQSPQVRQGCISSS